MRITRLVAGTVTAGLLGITPIAISAPAQATEILSTTTTATPSATALEYGDDFYIAVDVPSSDGYSAYSGTSTLYAMEAGSATWVPLATNTSAGSDFFDVKPNMTTSYKVVYTGYTAATQYEDTYTASESVAFTVGVTRKVVFKNPKGTLIKGKVTPNYGKKKIKVAKKVGNKWKKYKTFKTDNAGRYKFTLPAPRRGKTQWRITVPGDSQFIKWETKGYTYSSRPALASRVTFTR